jgi:Tol biopolymer transport system component/DNA-binding winged helix-turn-helix (wHTH) protein
MEPAAALPEKVHFGVFEADLASGELYKRGRKISLQDQPFQVLALLLRHPGEIVTREDLHHALWPAGTFVEVDHSVHTAIKKLRQALGDPVDNPRFIETLPRKGYRFIAPVEKLEIPTPAENPESAVDAAAPDSPDTRLSAHKALAGGVILTILLACGFFWWHVRSSRALFQHIELQRLTTEGNSREAAISPDGRYLARVSVDGEEQMISLRQLKTAAEIRLVPTMQAEFSSLQFSHDGEYLYFTQSKHPEGAALYRVPSLGGPSRLILDNVTGSVAISPDESRFAYLAGGPGKGTSLVVTGPSFAGKQTILSRNEPDFLRGELSWSPDGSRLAVPIGSYDDRSWRTGRVLIAPLNQTTPAILAPLKWAHVASATWLPNGRGLLVVGEAERFARFQIWFVPYPVGEPRRVTNDLNNHWGVRLTADSGAFVTVQEEELGEMWTTAPHAGAPSQLSRTSANGDGDYGITWTPDGRLVYASSAFGPPDLWISDADGRNPKRLTFGGVAMMPTLPPDGRTIYFGSERSGACHIWRMNIDGSEAKQVTRGSGEEWASLSPDGKWLYFVPVNMNNPLSIWKMAMPSGTPVRVGDLKDVFGPSISPDGQWLSVDYADERFLPPAGVGIMRPDGTGFKPLKMPRTPFRRWSPDGRALYFVRAEHDSDNIWKQDIVGGAATQVTRLSSGSISWLAVSRDERLAFRHSNAFSDVVLIRSVQ